MDFKTLNTSTLANYLRTVPSVTALLGDMDALDIVEVGDGNLNYVYFVSSLAQPGNSLVVKQALPYMRLVGESWPLTRHRSDREAHALRQFGALCPQHVPQVLHFDSEQSLIIMQRLSDHLILRKGLIQGLRYPKLAEHLSTYLAQTLFHGSDLFLSAAAKKQAAAATTNSELSKITEDLVFTCPFEDHASNAYSPALPRTEIERLHNNPALRVAAAQMKWAFMNQAETLLHGDLHTGSVMVNQTDTYVIDPEFACYGPFGFDVGLLLANFFTAYYAQDWQRPQAGEDPAPYQDWLLAQASSIWCGFSDKFLALWVAHEAPTTQSFMGDARDADSLAWFRTSVMRQIFSDTLGFAGCELIRRTLGLAKVAEVASIPDAQARAAIELRCLRLGEALLLQRHHIIDMNQVLDLAR
ncbi:S-methyl-5-thioribose kinase [Rhodoferax sp. U11-2br]|uniref:S-methyl-5-thioribose kinase n=1 Tax=Rhodoferax sp. U11-2br TaxID=2838878 RepID=UPI001BED2F80|nr:S-methyl-5-thioribose kinase [Rhodoferax sp. U11-2br]MBT3065543.1 S-methyl-5-thioribose kinase [Rhodoferax sp. U11-2br]